jgi:hypothetical protein
MAEHAVHADVEPLAFLVGTWRGEGSGEFPTIESFRYLEEMVFEHAGGTFLLYSERSWLAGDPPMPVHFERGFFRPGPGPGRVEITLSHPLGLVEVSEGSVRDGSIHATSTSIAATATGDPVTRLRRHIAVRDDVLRYELEMATSEVALARHLVGELRRVPE